METRSLSKFLDQFQSCDSEMQSYYESPFYQPLVFMSASLGHFWLISQLKEQPELYFYSLMGGSDGNAHDNARYAYKYNPPEVKPKSFRVTLRNLRSRLSQE